MWVVMSGFWGDFGLGGVLAPAAPGSCVGGLPWRQRAWAEDGERHKGFSERKLSALAPAHGDACGYRYPLGGIDAATFSTIGLRAGPSPEIRGPGAKSKMRP
jgi:hypothetical protein